MIYFTKEYCIRCRTINGVNMGELHDFTVDNIWGFECWDCGEKVQMSEYDGNKILVGARVFILS